MSITPTIDLRATHGRARQQGQRKTCLAFALSDLNGHRHSRPAQLSPEHLYREAAAHMPGWKPDGGLTLEAALRAVSAPGQALEAAVPYQDADPPLPLAPAGLAVGLGGGSLPPADLPDSPRYDLGPPRSAVAAMFLRCVGSYYAPKRKNRAKPCQRLGAIRRNARPATPHATKRDAECLQALGIGGEASGGSAVVGSIIARISST